MALTARGNRAAFVKGGGAFGIEASGMDGATEMLAMLQKLGASTQGISLLAKKYPGTDTTVGDVINYLAGFDKDGETAIEPPGGVVRDIRPTSEDADYAANLFVKRVESRLRMMSKRGAKYLKRWDEAARARFIASGSKAADAAAAAGLREGGKHIKEIMTRRVEAGMYAPPTSDAYKVWRFNKYGISPSVALRASGLLVKNLQGGQLKLSSRGTLAEKFLSIADEATDSLI